MAGKSKPVVGVIGNAHVVNDRHNVQLVGQRNMRAVAEVAGALPLMFAGTPDITDIDALLGAVDGILLTGGGQGKRYALPHSKILIHQPWVQQIGGQASDVEIAARDLIATRRMLAGIYEHTTKKPIEQILKDIDRDYYMTAEEARDYGLVDQIFNKEMRSSGAPSPA